MQLAKRLGIMPICLAERVPISLNDDAEVAVQRGVRVATRGAQHTDYSGKIVRSLPTTHSEQCRFGDQSHINSIEMIVVQAAKLKKITKSCI